VLPLGLPWTYRTEKPPVTKAQTVAVSRHCGPLWTIMKSLSCPLLWAFALLSESLAAAALASIPLNYNSSPTTARFGTSTWRASLANLLDKT
jgi:hypothetical protein